MARYIGPKTKIARKFGAAIYGDDKSFEKRKGNFFSTQDVWFFQFLKKSYSHDWPLLLFIFTTFIFIYLVS